MSIDDKPIFSIVPKEPKVETVNDKSDNEYVIEDIDGNTYWGEGYLIFTSHHVAIMRGDDEGTVPVMVVPLARVKVASMIDEYDSDQA